MANGGRFLVAQRSQNRFAIRVLCFVLGPFPLGRIRHPAAAPKIGFPLVLFGHFFGNFGDFLAFGGNLGRGYFGGTFGEAWGRLWGDFWETLGRPWEALGRLWKALGRLWGGFGETLGRSDRPSVRPTDRPTI